MVLKVTGITRCAKYLIMMAAISVGVMRLCAQKPANYDESKAGGYTLPDPLILQDGERIHDPTTWTEKRRPELIRLFEENIYGHTPRRRLAGLHWKVFNVDRRALNGLATRKQVMIYFTRKEDGPKMDMLIYIPNGVNKPVPLFLCMSFGGLNTIADDPGIEAGDVWSDTAPRVRMPAASWVQKYPQAAFKYSSMWQVKKVLNDGYGFAAIYYGDIEPDFLGGIDHSVRRLFFKPGQTKPAPGDWGAIGAWAWGLSRGMDYLETDNEVDHRRVIVMGHSRLGKAALWAGAQDDRFSMVIANCSGKAGASLLRHNYGETAKDIYNSFPWWFTENFQKYQDDVNELPVDAHELIALIAPRPVYLDGAIEDRWADPLGAILAANAAAPVFKLFGEEGLDIAKLPPPDSPIMHTLGFHYRPGVHAVTEYDWEQFLKFADLHLKTRN